MTSSAFPVTNGEALLACRVRAPNLPTNLEKAKCNPAQLTFTPTSCRTIV